MDSNDIQINLTDSEYDSTYTAIKYYEAVSINDGEVRTLNRVLLKLMKAKDPKYFANVGPW